MKGSVLKPAAKDLYEQDFFEWTVQNAALLRTGRVEDADLERIAEEIEDMGKSERRELRSRVRVLMSHLLKWKLQANRRSRGWRATIHVQREEAAQLLQQMPSLHRYLEDQLPDLYPVAVQGAIADTDLPDSAFPSSCPFSLDQILDRGFFPD